MMQGLMPLQAAEESPVFNAHKVWFAITVKTANA
jgi:hypothetical protein